MPTAPLTIVLFGSFAVLGPDGTILTPRSQKVQALVALLATAKGFRRSRAWLQDRLWSDRAPKQAAGSLRQAILELKRCLGPHADALVTTRSTIELSPEFVALHPRPSAPRAEAEFLAGIDARDPEFEDWLREMRQHFANRPATPAAPAPLRQVRRAMTLALLGAENADHDLNLLEAFFLDSVKQSVLESFDVDFVSGLPNADSAPRPMADLLIRVQALQNMAGQRWLRATLESPTSLHCFWSESVELTDDDAISKANMASLSLAHRLVSAFAHLALDECLGAAQASVRESDFLAASALRKMFTMRAEEVDAAEALLTKAIEMDRRGLYHAWQAQVLSIRYVEQQSRDLAALRDASEAHVRKALEHEPQNSNVLASAANARLIFDGDTLQSAALAQRAVSSNRANPLAWFAWSNAGLYGGAIDSSYAAAVTAQALAARSSIEFWTAFQRSLTAAVRGQLSEALGYASLSSALAPSFRPPLRYMAGIACKLERLPVAARAFERLAEIEKDFSIERMVMDPAYPVSMMRRAELIGPETLAQLR